MGDHDDDANRDGAVGDVEDWPAPAVIVQPNEIDDVAVQQPVDQVADRSAQYQRNGQRKPAIAVVDLAQPADEEYAHGHRQQAEKPALPAAMSGQKAEGSAAV